MLYARQLSNVSPYSDYESDEDVDEDEQVGRVLLRNGESQLKKGFEVEAALREALNRIRINEGEQQQQQRQQQSFQKRQGQSVTFFDNDLFLCPCNVGYFYKEITRLILARQTRLRMQNAALSSHCWRQRSNYGQYTLSLGAQRLINLEIPVFVRSLKSNNVELG